MLAMKWRETKTDPRGVAESPKIIVDLVIIVECFVLIGFMTTTFSNKITYEMAFKRINLMVAKNCQFRSENT